MRTRLGLIAAMFLLATGSAAADPAGVEFFETKVRPVLAEHCYACHGPKKQKAGLRLDSLAALRAGGERGPAVVPGKPDDSLLIQVIRYLPDGPQMPPKAKLPAQAIADLTAWVAMGAPGPMDAPAAVAKSGFDLAERLRHWAYQPVRRPPVPQVKGRDWPLTVPDAFLLAGLETAGLTPAAEADRRTLIRRVTFDLIGLPPTPAEIDAFLADRSPDAWEKVIDRLLASPHYGERWGRHWLDLVRYAETQGHEFDYDLHHAWRYRDYVIRAFNADVPYDQFVREHLAGDLLSEPRRNPLEGFNESVIGTGFWWLGEAKHSPVDLRQEQADRIDNQLDVLGKAFLAQTLACARCHDHKFDALPARDYYGLFGYLKSSRYHQAAIDPPERIAVPAGRLAALKPQLQAAAAQALAPQAADLDRYLRAVQKVRQGIPAAEAARAEGVDDEALRRWSQALAGELPGALQPWAGKPLPNWVEGLKPQAADGWSVTGEAFGAGLTQTGEVAGGERLRFLPGGWADSSRLSHRLEGTLRSPTFTLATRYVHCYAAGQHARMNLVIDGFNLIRDPIYGGLNQNVNDPRPRWYTFDVRMWQGHRAYLEVLDTTTPDPTKPLPPEAQNGQSGKGWVALRTVQLADQGPPATPHPLTAALQPVARDPAALAGRYRDLVVRHLERWGQDLPDDAEGDGVVELVNWLLDRGLLELRGERLTDLLNTYRAIEATIPAPTRVPAMADGTGEDEQVYLRGSYRNPGPPAPRQPPAVVLIGHAPPEPGPGSGRLGLARSLTDPQDPLLARVMVNRLWYHHFGAGLVRTPDDFGRMGEPPTHPELLDWLAAEFVARGWSVKAMHRLLLTSRAYRMGGAEDPKAATLDPQNKLWHRMPVRRLEAEALRDAILQTSGRLDRAMGGPSVLPHLTAFMEGRGRPASGPLDGAGRRSVYLSVRRNFLTPLFLAFDYPTPFTTIGRRTVSNVPAQALTLLNDPFVLQQARRWAEATLAAMRPPADRVAGLYRTAYGRPPAEEETAAALAFVADQARGYGAGPDDVRAWADLCHVLINAKEFLYVP